MSRCYTEGAERQTAMLKENMIRVFMNLAGRHVQRKPELLTDRGFMKVEAWQRDELRDRFDAQQAEFTVAPQTPGMAPASP